ATPVERLELGLYGEGEGLAAGTVPFAYWYSRSSGAWPDGPENDLGELGFEVSPNVLGDDNGHLYGKPDYQSLILYGGELSPDSVYQVTFAGPTPNHLWVHATRPGYFTMPATVLQSPEPTLQVAVYGPAAVTRQLVDPGTTRFIYDGLEPQMGTGVKEDYPVQDYGQRPGSHGNGDFGWFPGFALAFFNEGPDAVFVALFITTGFTGPSGAPSNELANDTFWKSSSFFLVPGDSVTAGLDFDRVSGFSIQDNPFPHTAGDAAAAEGTAGVAVNVFDRLQVSAVGWEVRSVVGGPMDASLLVRPAGYPLGARPNPTGSAVTLDIALSTPAEVEAAVFDVQGRQVRTLLHAAKPAGTHSFTWETVDNEGRALASGIYFVRLRANGMTDTRKIAILR
ncbi:MAG: FlgD immunoglobulin-like domain containing protein, partial [bacterium]